MPGHRLCGLLDFDMPETKKKPFSSVIETPTIPASFAPVSRYVPRLRMGQSPCPSRRVQAGFGPLFRRCEEASIQSICRPRRFTKDEKQSRRKNRRFCGAGSLTTARSAGSCRVLKWRSSACEIEAMTLFSAKFGCLLRAARTIRGVPGLFERFKHE